MEIQEIVAAFAKALGVQESNVIASFDKEYPECLCVVLTKDVGPKRMNAALEALKSLNVKRAVVNVFSSRLAARFRTIADSYSPAQAFKESWELGPEATVRWE